MEDKITADGVPHSKLKQPTCPWCGMDMRCGGGCHLEWFGERGLCGSEWFPDFDGGHLEGRKQSPACEEIVRLKAKLSQAERVVVPDLTCDRVEQTVAHVPGVSKGNCFSALLAGMLKIPIESIPEFDGEDWRKKVNSFLRQFGLAWVQIGGLDEWLPDYGIEGCWHELDGQTTRFEGNVRHCCAGLDGQIAWDPHPSQEGLAEVNGGAIFVALRPWQVAHSVPASRVLKDGEIAVDTASLTAYRSALSLAEFASEHEIDAMWRASLQSVREHFDALRAKGK